MVVDDETELAEAIAARLRSDGHVVELAGDGPSAVELIASARPDLVILDLMLPGFDGLEVCRRIQHDHSIPLIMLTARGAETDRVVGLELAPTTICASRSECASSSPGSGHCSGASTAQRLTPSPSSESLESRWTSLVDGSGSAARQLS